MPVPVQEVIATFDGLSFENLETDEKTRREIIASAERALARLRTPYEQLWNTGYVSPMVIWTTRVLVDIGLYEGWGEIEGREATLQELWEVCKVPNVDIELLRRLLRVVVAAHLVQEVGEARYKSTPTSLALADPNGVAVRGLLRASLHLIMPMALVVPKFLQKLQYETPLDPNLTGYMELTGGVKLFEMFARDPQAVEQFAGTMAAFADIKLDWTQIYDTEQLLKGFDFDEEGINILFVDIGGGTGIDINRLLNRHPHINFGRIILQDLPQVVADAKTTVSEKAICQEYDFFKEQPVIGARAYFLHAVLHDWDDIDARRILKQVAQAMRRGYSKLLVCDIAMPLKGATLFQAFSDMAMLTMLSTKDRTEERWIRLLRSADFEIIKIWRHEVAADCLIEAELARPQTITMPARRSWGA